MDKDGNTLNIGKLQFLTLNGKQPMLFIDNVIPCDVKTVLNLVVNLFLEQNKVEDEDSLLRDSSMKIIKITGRDQVVHANSIGKVCIHEFILCEFILYDFILCEFILYEFMYLERTLILFT